MGFFTKYRYALYLIGVVFCVTLIFTCKSINSTWQNLNISLLASLIVAILVDLINTNIQSEQNKKNRADSIANIQNFLKRNLDYSIKRLKESYALINKNFEDLKKFEKSKNVIEKYGIIAKNDLFILNFVQDSCDSMMDYEADEQKRLEKIKIIFDNQKKYGNEISDIYLNKYYGIKFLKKTADELDNVLKNKNILTINQIFSVEELKELDNFGWMIKELFTNEFSHINSAYDIMNEVYQSLPAILKIVYKDK